jgi:DNA-binding CsgD family transcriptional regulator
MGPIKRHMALARPPHSIARQRADEPADDAAAPDRVLHQLIEGLTHDSRNLEARFKALEGVADRLHAEVGASTQRLRLLITQLELAEQRLRREAPAAPKARRGATKPGRAGAACGRSAIGKRIDAPAAEQHLCAREREVLKLLTEGMHSPRIAERLGIKTATVGVHRRNIMRKLNLHSVAALTKYALRAGLIAL